MNIVLPGIGKVMLSKMSDALLIGFRANQKDDEMKKCREQKFCSVYNRSSLQYSLPISLDTAKGFASMCMIAMQACEKK